MRKCGDPRCGTCEYIDGGDYISFKSGDAFKVDRTINCKSQNLINCATCSSWKENYIRQTGDALIDWVRVHKQQIKDPSVRNIPCCEHFDRCTQKKFRIFISLFFFVEDKSFRLWKEVFFVKAFKPKLNSKWHYIAAERCVYIQTIFHFISSAQISLFMAQIFVKCN